ncbi:MAG: hypothetical protein M3256_19550 [Actinomycetota bacterium]|nr:hypothetical protein [Actinomycetota bacterium]
MSFAVAAHLFEETPKPELGPARSNAKCPSGTWRVALPGNALEMVGSGASGRGDGVVVGEIERRG